MKQCLIATVLAFIVLSSRSSSASGDSAAIARTVEDFHTALSRGDAKAAMRLLASDGIILENGYIETRAEYESAHLAADIKFAREVHTSRSAVRVVINGHTGWLTSRLHTKGEFEGKRFNSSGVELIILAKSAGDWKIRAIHWSSHKVTKVR